MLKPSASIILAVMLLAGCGTQETDAERQQAEAKEAHNVAAMQIGLFVTALDAYKSSVGEIPSTKQGLQALRTCPPGLLKSRKWDGPYLTSDASFPSLKKDLLVDPWGHPYQYRLPGIHKPDSFDVWSVGPDGVDGSQDDIGNWNVPRLGDMLNPDEHGIK